MSASSTDLPAPVGPTISIWPTSPTWVESRNGVEPEVCAWTRGEVAAERLQGQVRIDDFVVGVAVEQLDRLVVHHLAQQLGDRFPLVEPLAPDSGQRPGCLGLVERDEAGDPTISKGLVVERI